MKKFFMPSPTKKFLVSKVEEGFRQPSDEIREMR
jgi:hypothetical protein